MDQPEPEAPVLPERTVFPDLGRNLADLESPFPQPGTWQEVEWVWNRGLLDRDIMERARAARWAVRAADGAGRP